MRRVLCIWLPHWPLQRLLQTKPDLRRKTVLLYTPASRGAFNLLDCSRRASDAGVTPGMTLAEAQGLLNPDEPLHNEPHDPHADHVGLRDLAIWCQRFSPLVGLEESDAPSSLLLDITGCAHLFGGEQAMLERVVQTSAERRLRVRVGIADTVGAAWAVAHFGQNDVVLPGEQDRALDDFPVEALRLSEEMPLTLRELDLGRIGQLRALPRSSLKARFGIDVLLRLDQLAGTFPELIRPERPVETIAVDYPFDYPVRSRQTLDKLLQQAIERIVAQAGLRCEGVQHLVCRFHREGSTPTEVAVRLIRPSLSMRHIWELLCLQLERSVIPSEVSHLHVYIEASGPLEWHACTLLDEDGYQRNEKELMVLIERLSHRLGEQAVVRPKLCADAQPEHRVQYEPLVSDKRSKKSPSEEIPAGLTRPLFVLPEPAGVEVLSVVPDGPPIRFSWRKTEHRIASTWGPERIETGWWRGEHVRRDYYRIETESGRWFWLFRQRDDGRWFVHGTFE